MDEDLDLATRAQVERGLDELGYLGDLADVCLDGDGLDAVAVDGLTRSSERWRLRSVM